MAVTVSSTQTKVKLVRMTEDAEGNAKRSSTTFSNLAAGAQNESIMTGFKAMYGLMQTAPDELHRVDDMILTEA
jgi:hypothetical protein